MNHRKKQRLARRLSGRQSGHFESQEWESRRQNIAKRIENKIKEEKK